MKETDASVLMRFRAEADKLCSTPAWEVYDTKQRAGAIATIVRPYLKQLEQMGWSQRERMVTLIKVWHTVENNKVPTTIDPIHS